MFVHRKQGLFLSVCKDAIKMAGMKQMKNLDLVEPTSFLDHVYLGCTQWECRPNEIIEKEHKNVRITYSCTRATEKLLGWQEPHAHTVAASCDMEGHAQKCVERYFELAKQENKAT